MNIGLMGFEFNSANKGCEALSYAIINFLNECFCNQPLTIYVWDTKLGIIPEHFPNIKFKYVPIKLKDIKCRWIRTVIKCNYILDVTMGDSFSDIYSVNYCLGLIKTKKYVELLNRNYILMPQTYGPFNNSEVKKKALYVINKAKVIISRDRTSIEYLRSMGISKKMEEHIDLAFMLPFDKSKFSMVSKKKKLGINISGLLWHGGFNRVNQFSMSIEYKEYIVSIIKKYIDSIEWEIHLIPHVIDLNEKAYDDDYRVLESIHDMFKSTILAPPFENPIEAKSYIANMDCFIGSRMHSTIAALSSGVPVIPVSYSRKFEGLFDSLNYKYLIHGNEDNTEDAVRRTVEYVDDYEEISKIIKKIKPEIDGKVKELKKIIQNILSE